MWSPNMEVFWLICFHRSCIWEWESDSVSLMPWQLCWGWPSGQQWMALAAEGALGWRIPQSHSHLRIRFFTTVLSCSPHTSRQQDRYLNRERNLKGIFPCVGGSTVRNRWCVDRNPAHTSVTWVHLPEWATPNAADRFGMSHTSPCLSGQHSGSAFWEHRLGFAAVPHSADDMDDCMQPSGSSSHDTHSCL